MKRRSFIAAAGAMATAAALPRSAWALATGRLKQAVSRQVFGNGALLEDSCKLASSMGIKAFDFVNEPSEWPILKRYGLTVSMLRSNFNGKYSPGRPLDGVPGWDAIGQPNAQGAYLESIHAAINVASTNQFPNVIVLAGERGEVGYNDGADNAVAFLNKVKAHAEDKRVTLCMEILNSRGFEGPPRSLFDHMDWGVGVMKRVNSPRVKILYDVFHAQLMEGHIVHNIRDNIQRIGHFHLGSVPDRHELLSDDELNYHYIAQSIADLNFQGFVTHEWTPSPGSNPTDDLRRSIDVMTV